MFRVHLLKNSFPLNKGTLTFIVYIKSLLSERPSCYTRPGILFKNRLADVKHYLLFVEPRCSFFLNVTDIPVSKQILTWLRSLKEKHSSNTETPYKKTLIGSHCSKCYLTLAYAQIIHIVTAHSSFKSV